MPGYIVYWPKDRLREIQQAKDSGPIKVVFGSIHSRMSTIASIKEGDLTRRLSEESLTYFEELFKDT